MANEPTDELIAMFASMGGVTPSQAAPWLNLDKMRATLLERGKQKSRRRDRESGSSDADETTTPLWTWLVESGVAGWSEGDISVLDAWCGGRKRWWLHPVDNAGRTMLDAWLDRCAHGIVMDARALPLLHSVPSECFRGQSGQARVAMLLAAERAVSTAASIKTPKHHASEDLLARDIDLFEDIGNLQHASTAAQLEQAKTLHAVAAMAWLAKDGNYVLSAKGHAARDVRDGLAELAGKQQASSTRDAGPHHDRETLDALFADAVSDFMDASPHARAMRTLLGAYPELVSARDAQGRTVLMAALDAATKDRKRVRRVHINAASLVHTRAYRSLCKGSDAEGRTLWPYLLRAMQKVPSTSSKRLVKELGEEVGQPAQDSAGHGLLHQVLYNRTPSGGYESQELTAYDTSYGYALPEWFGQVPWQVWLGEGHEDTLPQLLMDRLLDVPPASRLPFRKCEVNFLCDVAECLSGSPAVLPAPWSSLFLNAMMMRAATGLHIPGPLETRRMKDLMVAGVTVSARTQDIIGRCCDDEDVARELNDWVQMLNGEHALMSAPAPKRSRPRA